jgi:hypothetical protein
MTATPPGSGRFWGPAFLRNVQGGVYFGLCIAFAFAALSVALLVITGQNPFRTMGMPWFGGVACYLISGIVGGAIAGALRPLGQWLVGSLFIGAVVITLARVVFFIGESGHVSWNGETAVQLVGFGIVGAIGGPIIRSKLRATLPASFWNPKP